VGTSQPPLTGEVDRPHRFFRPCHRTRAVRGKCINVRHRSSRFVFLVPSMLVCWTWYQCHAGRARRSLGRSRLAGTAKLSWCAHPHRSPCVGVLGCSVRRTALVAHHGQCEALWRGLGAHGGGVFSLNSSHCNFRSHGSKPAMPSGLGFASTKVFKFILRKPNTIGVKIKRVAIFQLHLLGDP
jgi:hypothetical protein